MGGQIKDKEIKELIARFIRAKLIREPIGNSEENWERMKREALSTPVDYSCEEWKQVDYYYVFNVGGEKFNCIYNIEKDLIEVFRLVRNGKSDLFLSLPLGVLESLKGKK